ncbi:MAG: hypothetical protein ACKV0T_19735 [Planctomycetales bacterium]
MAGDAEAAKSALDKMSVIPDVFYDVIARITPGCALLTGVMWGTDTMRHLLGDKSSIAAFALFLGAGYVVGMALTTLSLVWDGAWWLCHKGMRLLKGRNPKDRDDVFNDPMSLTKRVIDVSRGDPVLGSVLFKSFAEVTLFENLLSASILYWAKFHPHADWGICGVMGLLLIGMIYRMSAFVTRVRWAEDIAAPERQRAAAIAAQQLRDRRF